MTSSVKLDKEHVQATPAILPDQVTSTVSSLIEELRMVMSTWEETDWKKSSGYRRWLSWGGLGGMSLALFGTLATQLGAPAWVAYLSFVSLLVGTVASVATGIANARAFLMEWRSIEADMLDAASKRMQLWHEVIVKIRERYTPDQARFAQDYVSAVCTQIRARLSYVVGPLDKVGLIPLLASAALALYKFFQEWQLPFVWCAATAVAGILYLVALRFIEVTFTLERLGVILKHAAERPEGY